MGYAALRASGRALASAVALAAAMSVSAASAQDAPEKEIKITPKKVESTPAPAKAAKPAAGAPAATANAATGAGKSAWVKLCEKAPLVKKDKDGKEVEHRIKPIWLGKYEVRWNDYDPFWQRLDLDIGEIRNGVDAKSRPSKPYLPPDGGYGVDGFPAGGIHIVAAKKYCAWLSKQTGKQFRLPTEAEWEYACRAGGPPVKPDLKALDKVAWYNENSKEEPHAVGKKDPNAWGFYDMLGNVAEFVIIDPDDNRGVVAGGSFMDEAQDVYSGAREPYKPYWQKADSQIPKSDSWMVPGNYIGFRVVMEDSPEAKPSNPLAPNSK